MRVEAWSDANEGENEVETSRNRERHLEESFDFLFEACTVHIEGNQCQLNQGTLVCQNGISGLSFSLSAPIIGWGAAIELVELQEQKAVRQDCFFDWHLWILQSLLEQ